MGKSNFNKRLVCSNLEEPMAVSPKIIELCRSNVEPFWKRYIRFVLNNFLAHIYKLKKFGEGCQIGRNSKVPNASLGHYSSFGPKCEFNGPVVIGDLTMLSSEVLVVGQDHDAFNADLPMRIAFPQKERPVTVIEADCWIGARVTIMEGVRIGRGSVVGASSVVTRSIPPYSIAVGVPAKVIKQRFDLETQKQYDFNLYEKF